MPLAIHPHLCLSTNISSHNSAVAALSPHLFRFIQLCEQAERGTPEETREAHEQFVREAAMIQLQ
eukprot:scaffold75127_cov19-Tisochrysis_lutea.AAC.1